MSSTRRLTGVVGRWSAGHPWTVIAAWLGCVVVLLVTDHLVGTFQLPSSQNSAGELADLALPDTAFPHLSLVRQMDLERVLAEALADRGVEVERGTELAGVRDGPVGVRAVLRSECARW